MILIVGAGLAGLTCAKVLVEAKQDVLVLEASGQVGASLRTFYHEDGYRLDRGFQVLFTAYAAASRHLDYQVLKQRKLEPGAILVKNGKLYEIADPLREPARTFSSLLNPLLPAADKMRVLRLRMQLARLSTSDIFVGKKQPEGHDETSEAYLRREGFSDTFIDNFVRPFYGGIFLDRSLSTSAAMFRFVFKMLSEGDAVLPAEGIGAITDQLVRLLPINDVRYNVRVAEVLTDGTRALGVRTDDGIVVEADAVVVATEPPTTARLTGVPMPATPVASTCVYYMSPRPLYRGKKILVNANPDALVNNLAQLSNVAPSYAPPGQHLLSATVLGLPEGRDDDLALHARDDIKRMLPRADVKMLTPLAVVRVPFSQLAQPPGFYNSLPTNEGGIAGRIVAGEATLSSSIQGAMLSGQRAAEA